MAKGRKSMHAKSTVLILLIPGLVVLFVLQNQKVFSQPTRQNRGERFRHNGVIENEDHSSFGALSSDAAEAPTGFDNLTNGFTEQGAPFETLNEDNACALLTTTGSSSRKLKNYRTGSVRPIMRRAVASATKTLSREARAR
jgi:hypothetical protein